MESFGRYIAVLIAITLLFVIPIQQGNNKLQRVRKMYVTELLREFVEESAHQSEITLQEWKLLCERLPKGQCQFFLRISVGERKDIGDHESYYRMTYDEEIKETLFEEGCYPLRTGDILMLQVREAKAGRYECIWKSV